MGDSQKFKITLAVAILLLIGFIVYMIMVMNKAKKLESYLTSKGLTMEDFDAYEVPSENGTTTVRRARKSIIQSPITA